MGRTGTGPGVYAQRYDATGTKVGSEFQVNTYTTRSQFVNGATALADGGYVITWTSEGQDGSGFGIYSQRYDASGQRVGIEQRVNTHTIDDQVQPDIAALSHGGYVVSWMVAAKDGSVSDIYAQRFSASGARGGDELRVNSDPEGYQGNPAVSGLANGAYVIAWTSGGEIYAQRFDASGQRVGSEFRVNTYTNNDQGDADVARLEDGGFVITWSSLGQDGSGSGIYAQRYNAAGVAVGGEVQVNTTTGSDQRGAAVTALADGGYAITWSYDDQWTSGGIYAQIFDASGARVGGEQRVSSTTDRGHNDVSIAALANGSFVVTWGYIGDQTGVFARQFNPVASMVGDSGNNNLTGTSGADNIDGGAGNDLISGLSGNDVLTGARGVDVLFGGDGNDTISSDRMIGFDGNTDVDTIYGGSGNDMMFAGYGDIVDGGDGFDTLNLSYVGASHGITGDTNVLFRGLPLSPGGGTVANIERFDAVALTEFRDVMVIGDQADPATAYGYGGDDHLIGQEHRVVFYGGDGNDLLVGSLAGDVLYGESGNDILIGGPGQDELWGGSGNDRFLYTHIDGSPDTIGDFVSGTDTIDLTGIDADTTTAGNQAFTFVGGLFSNRPGEMRIFNAAGTGNILELDVNGDGGTDLTIILGSAQVVTSDFLL